jgi:predicted metal-dependent hydrolase
MDPHKKNQIFDEGLKAFNSGHFFEAHELWEEVWLETRGPDKAFLQGLIQVAAAFHHYSRANLRGTRNLLQAGLLKLERFPEAHSGLAIEPLRSDVRVWLSALESMEMPENVKIPTIARHPGKRLSV